MHVHFCVCPCPPGTICVCQMGFRVVSSNGPAITCQQCLAGAKSVFLSNNLSPQTEHNYTKFQ